MALNGNKIPASGGKRQPVLEPDTYPARLVQVIDLGLQQPRPYKGQEKPPCHMIRLTYELVNEFCVDEEGKPDHERPRWVGEEMPFYSPAADKAKCNKRYIALDPKKEANYDWSKLLGAPCTVTLVNRLFEGKTYTNIASVQPLMKGMNIPDLVNEPMAFDQDVATKEQFDALPEWIQEKITKGLEFKGSRLDRIINSSTSSPVWEEVDEMDDVPF